MADRTPTQQAAYDRAQKLIADRAKSMAEEKQKSAERSYNTNVAKYAREKSHEMNFAPEKVLNEGLDSLGDKARAVGKIFGYNRMTSSDDEAQMRARKDIKGYKKGGKVSSASKRADGCAVRGKTRA
jgi:hypothetical protein